MLNRGQKRDSLADPITAEQHTEFYLPGYQLLGLLGRGGMGEVFSAVRENDRALVAIKILPEDCARHPELIRRFYMEAEAMAAVSHPNIVAVLDRGTIDMKSFIVVDYIPGCSLKQRIAEAAPLSLSEVVAIARSTAEAIQACHDQEMVHRDLKPGNVLLSTTGNVYVTDFGIANLLPRLGDNTDFGVPMGTPQYIAPEQLADGSSVDLRADQYSLAVIIYEMLTGALPQGVFEPPSEFRTDLPKGADETLLRALARDPAKRFSSVRAFMRSFRRALQITEAEEDPRQVVRRAVLESLHEAGREAGEDVRRVSGAWQVRQVDETEEESSPVPTLGARAKARAKPAAPREDADNPLPKNAVPWGLALAIAALLAFVVIATVLLSASV